MAKQALRLDPAQLHRRTDLSEAGFETTDDLPDIDEVVGQPRAVDAIKFGTGMKDDGFNIYALGPTGMDKRELVQQFFESRAKAAPTPSDWCYVYNFDQEHRPVAIELPAGKGREFHDDMKQLVEELRTALSAAFESEEYQSQRQTLSEVFRERQAEGFEQLQSRAREEDMALIRTPGGIAVAPTRDGEVLGPEEIQQLPEEEQKAIENKVEELQEELQHILRQVPGWQREMREKLNQLNSEMANLAVGSLIDELREKYADHEAVVKHLDALQKDVVSNADQFLPQQEQERGAQWMQAMQQQSQEQALRRYGVNVLIDHAETRGAPVVYEDNPTYQNLIGRVEHRAQMGALMTDFQLIKPGSLHRANGGYLILDVRSLLTQTYAWEGLKRALKSKDLRIESLGQQFSLISTVSLEPEAIPLQVKVALIGDRMLYYLLSQLDPDFDELFKVGADFDDQMDRDQETQVRYARLIASAARQEGLRPFKRSAVESLIERSSRIVGDSEKLSARMREITDLMRESNYWARERGQESVEAEDVQRAIDAQIYRMDRVRERSQETILRGTLLIDTEGEVVGQINGLSVMMLSNFAFGRPTRITARTRLGTGDVVDIEREVELGGPLHSKGVMILTGFLTGRYAQEQPLSLSASLVFEQSYGGVDGDSASSAELYALLSAIADVPIKQSFAVTGSVNQKGEVQAIGGVNEKIEGFFDICQKRGLTGEQGVLIPAFNVKHLMLRQDVVEAVSEGKFSIYAVEHIDQGIELLTGLSAGTLDVEGNYPEGTINYLVQARLKAMAERRRAFARAMEGGSRE
ncbi:MAG: AAA family ATPase [Anaerolineae bacterium]|nr:AAA family ATPase [Anaerolineae bacterium]